MLVTILYILKDFTSTSLKERNGALFRPDAGSSHSNVPFFKFRYTWFPFDDRWTTYGH
jgi:hypothetical protein